MVTDRDGGVDIDRDRDEMVTDRDGGVDIDRDRDRDGHRQGWRCRHRQRQRQRWSQTGMEV